MEGPLMILAGAGSGKTTVMVHRIANMIRAGKEPASIVAITFTNKASNELRERLSQQIGEDQTNAMHISTFHAFCSSILRESGDQIGLGLNASYGVISSSAAKQIVKEITTNFPYANEEDKALFRPHFVAKIIALLKNELYYPNSLIQGMDMTPLIDSARIKSVLTTDSNPSIPLTKEQITIIQQMYVAYQKKLVQQNRLDVDDILFYPLRILQLNPELLDYYQEKFTYFIVDEYQDTNKAQYGLLQILAKKYRNLAVVGDDGQSIFGFRGSDMRNILEFKKDYPEAFEVKLEQNYRSSKTILTASNQIISHNKVQTQKQLFTANEEGEKIRYFEAEHALAEAEFVAAEIVRLRNEKGYRYRDFAVFYRHNNESANFESVFPGYDLPYQVSSDSSFFERAEIRDLLSYLQFMNNPSSKSAFERIINTPKRGIGKTSIEKIVTAANGGDILAIVSDPNGIERLNKKTLQGLSDFSDQMKDLFSRKFSMSIADLIASVIDVVNYKSTYADLETYLKKEKDDYIAKLISLSMDLHPKSLDSFLQQVTKIDVDAQMKLEDDYDRINLTTIHSAKGLEFPVVFIVGMKENGFPSAYAHSPAEIEEERRLCYVAFTRAKELLYTTFPKTSKVQADKHTEPEIIDNVKSRFLDEYDSELSETIIR